MTKVFTYLEIDLVVSGTGLSLEELWEALASGVLKPDIFVFHHLGMFNTWEKLEPFLERYAPVSFLRFSGVITDPGISSWSVSRHFLFHRASLTGLGKNNTGGVTLFAASEREGRTPPCCFENRR